MNVDGVLLSDARFAHSAVVRACELSTCTVQGRSFAELADISAVTQARAECCQRWDDYQLQVMCCQMAGAACLAASQP